MIFGEDVNDWLSLDGWMDKQMYNQSIINQICNSLRRTDGERIDYLDHH